MTPLDDGEREQVLAEMAALARKLAPDPAAQMNEEIAGLREEIASLRQQVAAQHHGCCHHSCWHYYYPATFTTGTWVGGGSGSYTISTGGNTGGVIA